MTTNQFKEEFQRIQQDIFEIENLLHPSTKMDNPRQQRAWSCVKKLIRYLEDQGLIVLLLAASLLITPRAEAAIPESQAVKAILGEAEDQGYRGMLAVACALRNRDRLSGVYGVKAKRPNTPGAIPQKYWDMARKAWQESAAQDITSGADHWENVKAYGTPYWAKGKTPVAQVRDHNFYDLEG